VALLGRIYKARVKSNVLSWVKLHVLVGLRVASLSRIYYGRRHGAVWVLGAIIQAMSTPSLHSLGLSAAHRVAPCWWFAHSGLVPIGHECTVGHVDHKCVVVWKVHRS
jgi:hypothetical protein